MAQIELTVTMNSKDLGDENYDKLWDLTLNGIEIYPKDEYAPVPWDASLYIEDGMMVMDGYFSPGNAKSTCVAKVPLNQIMKVVGLSVGVEDENEEEVRAIFKEYGWL